MFSFSDMVHFLPYKFSCLCGWGFAFSCVLFGPLQRLSFWHFESSSYTTTWQYETNQSPNASEIPCRKWCRFLQASARWTAVWLTDTQPCTIVRIVVKRVVGLRHPHLKEGKSHD